MSGKTSLIILKAIKNFQMSPTLFFAVNFFDILKDVLEHGGLAIAKRFIKFARQILLNTAEHL